MFVCLVGVFVCVAVFVWFVLFCLSYCFVCLFRLCACLCCCVVLSLLLLLLLVFLVWSCLVISFLLFVVPSCSSS